MKPLVDAVRRRSRTASRRRERRRCHTGQVRSGCRLNSCGIVTEIPHESGHPHGQATIEIAAQALIYDVIADVTTMGERSPECYCCEWVGETHEPIVGARFQGHNRMGPIRWTTTCEIVTADRGREFAFTVIHDKNGRESTRWRYRLEDREWGPCSPSPSSSCGAPWRAASESSSCRGVGSCVKASTRRCNTSKAVAESNVTTAKDSQTPPR